MNDKKLKEKLLMFELINAKKKQIQNENEADYKNIAEIELEIEALEKRDLDLEDQELQAVGETIK